MRVIFRGRRNIWRCWRVTSVSPRIVNDVSYVTRINHESHFVAGAVLFVVMLEVNLGCSAHCK